MARCRCLTLLPSDTPSPLTASAPSAHGFDRPCLHLSMCPCFHSVSRLLRMHCALLQLSDFGLIVLDEAHHCAGNHAYSQLMQDFVLMEPVEQRPQVLGLTASPDAGLLYTSDAADE